MNSVYIYEYSVVYREGYDLDLQDHFYLGDLDLDLR